MAKKISWVINISGSRKRCVFVVEALAVGFNKYDTLIQTKTSLWLCRVRQRVKSADKKKTAIPHVCVKTTSRSFLGRV